MLDGEDDGDLDFEVMNSGGNEDDNYFDSVVGCL